MKRSNSDRADVDYPEAYRSLKHPIDAWWSRFSKALGYRDVGAPGGRYTKVSPRVKNFLGLIGVRTEIHERIIGALRHDVILYPPADVRLIVECLRDYVQFPNVTRLLSIEFKRHIHFCVDAYREGGPEAFCKQWNQGEYLFPGQPSDMSAGEFLCLGGAQLELEDASE